MSPTIIDLRLSPKAYQENVIEKPTGQDAYPSPLSAASQEYNGIGAVAMSLDDPKFSDSSDSDSLDGMTDSICLSGDSHSGSEVADNEETLTESTPAFDLPKMIISGLCPETPGKAKTIPTMVLYDDRGLQLFDEITYLEEYYLTQEEIEILERDGDKIVEHIPDNSIVVELGAGSLRKTVLLLNALERKRKNICYFALDLMLNELTKSLNSLGNFTNVKTAGLWGTYDQGLAFVSSLGSEVPKTLLWLGSSIGNLTRQEARDFISSYSKTLSVGDNWIIGIDRRNDPQDITIAYNDPKGITREFIMNGLDHINVILGQNFIDREKLRYFAQYNVELGRHEAYYQVKESHELVYKDLSSETEKEVRVKLEKDELINVEYSYKWSLEESTQLFEQTEMTRLGQYTSASDRYDLHLVRKTPFYFKTTGSRPLPTQEEWSELWKAWDLITMSMIQHPSMLLEKPIDLRHPFLFYLGHIPVFLDTQISRVLNESFTEPAYFNVIFERGIDPDVDDPTKCHSHSFVPDAWPEIESIIEFRDRVRERLFRILNDTEKYTMTRRLARVLFMTFEHEVMHLETLIYMMVQSPNTLPPPSLTAHWSQKVGTNSVSSPSGTLPAATWISIDPSRLDTAVLALGHDDRESQDLLEENKTDVDSALGWDNENPLVTSRAPPTAFKIQSRQVTNNEYLAYLMATNDKNLRDDNRIPASWLIRKSSGEDEICVKTVYGPTPLSVAGEWPVSCSNIHATGYSAWFSQKSGQSYGLPTEHELSIALKLKQSTVPKTGLENYGLRQWYPTLDESCFKSRSTDAGTIEDFSGPGGLWDWTCTPFEPLDKERFEVSKLYPGYSSDFFDEKHMVVLGASWATHPRIAERRSFRNWYQANYPYVFAGFRLVQRC
ncbi:hypothetical protein BGX21_003958 [Mortierella sp. AD011]|nr:hypothetical protein BGX20_004346 [Mortierella sp. AD010]KAF9400597.1 hypothetical protein BGX21_003958 [Mortierella sp. AD011]